MNIGIIFGGKSFEHEISIITAYQVKKKLEEYHNVYMIYVDINGNIFDCSKMSFNDFKIKKKKKKVNLKKMGLDLIVGAMHGENGEDGLAYNYARINNINYFGSKGFGSAIALDKYKTYQFLSNNGIEMIETYLYTYQEYLSGKRPSNFPIIVKSLCGGSSIGIEVIYNDDEFDEKVNNVFKFNKMVVIQPYYDSVIEYNLALTELDYSNLEKINKKDEIFSFNNKYTDTIKLFNQNINNDMLYDEFKRIGRNIYNLLDLNGIVRIDFFVIDNRIYVNEINTTPGALSMGLFDDFIEIFNRSLGYVFNDSNNYDLKLNKILHFINK